MDPILKNVLEVVTYLDKSGWKISKSAAYKHKKEGKLRPDDAGVFPVKAVDRYAKQWLERKDGSGSIDALQEEKARAELEKLKAQATHWDTKTRIQLGQYVPRELFERELAARARVFKSDLENFFRGEASEIVRIAEGSMEKIPDLIDFMVREVEVWLGRYSRPKKWTVKLIDLDQESESETE